MLLLGAREARAEQFVLLDETFTFTKEQADHSEPSPSHVYVREAQLNQSRPRDWTAPVDYRHGSVHVRLEVLEKPAGNAITQWSLCYIPYVGIGEGYGCTGTGTYQHTGVVERDQAMTEFWQNDAIDWSRGIREMHLVLKDEDASQGHAHKREDAERFFPTRVRLTLTQVSAGAHYEAPTAQSALPDVRPAVAAVPPASAPAASCQWSPRAPLVAPTVAPLLAMIGASFSRRVRRKKVATAMHSSPQS